MISKIIKITLSVLFFIFSVCLFVFGHIGYGILALFISGMAILFYFRHEYMLAAFFYLRKKNFPKARIFLDKIKTPEKSLVKRQQSYYYFLLGICQSQTNIFASEKYFKKALSMGLRMSHDIAIAKLNLAGIAMSKGNKREAQNLLNDSKKQDKNKMLADQIKMMQQQMGMVGMQKAGMQSYQYRRRM